MLYKPYNVNTILERTVPYAMKLYEDFSTTGLLREYPATTLLSRSIQWIVRWYLGLFYNAGGYIYRGYKWCQNHYAFGTVRIFSEL